MILGLIFIVLAVGLDQLSKYWAVTRLASRGTIPLIENVFHLTYAENPGAAFSILQNSRWFLVAITSAAMIFIVVAVMRKWIEGRLATWAAYCVLAGGIGNLIDRVLNGFVVDMFDFRLINFAIFNIADVLVCIGGGLFAIYVIRTMISENTKKENNNNAKA